MKLNRIILVCLLVSVVKLAGAQEQVLLKGDSASTIKMYGDVRLQKYTKKKVVATGPPKGNYRTKGYRVQIYNGTDRKAANDARTSFMRTHPGLRSYLVFKAPYFRVRVGDYINKQDAANLANNLGGLFDTHAVIQDVINVSPKRK